MKGPTLKQIEEYRQKGLKPGVVCFCVNGNKLLVLHKKEYGLWLIPQGGILAGETPAGAMEREIKEELGTKLFKNIEKPYVYLGDGEVMLNKKFYGEHELETESGTKIPLDGKKYFFYAIAVKKPDLEIKDTEYDDGFWLDYEGCKYIFNRSYQVNKKELNLKMLDKLKEKGLL